MNTPTQEQLYALELAARRARNAEIARLLDAGLRALKAALHRAALALKVEGARHA